MYHRMLKGCQLAQLKVLLRQMGMLLVLQVFGHKPKSWTNKNIFCLVLCHSMTQFELVSQSKKLNICPDQRTALKQHGTDPTCTHGFGKFIYLGYTYILITSQTKSSGI